MYPNQSKKTIVAHSNSLRLPGTKAESPTDSLSHYKAVILSEAYFSGVEGAVVAFRAFTQFGKHIRSLPALVSQGGILAFKFHQYTSQAR
jgi:hypothetical protein